MTPCDCNHEMGDTCPKCAPTKPPVVLVANDSGGFDFPSGYLAVWGADPEWRCNNSGVNGSGLAHVGPTFATAKEAAAAIGALLPPRVGDKWGDLSPEQRAVVPVGSQTVFEYGDGARSAAIKVKPSEHRECWAPDSAGAVAVDSDDSLHADRRITRLGPAPTTEPDRSGWPEIAADIMALEEKIGADADPRDAEIARLRASLATALRDANEADNEAADLRRALEGQTHANAPLRDALSTLRGRLAFVLPDGQPTTDEALVAAVRKLADQEGDEAMLTAGRGLLDQAAWGNPTLGYIATVIRRGVGR